MTPILLEQQGSLRNSLSFYKRIKLKTLFLSSAHHSLLNRSLYQKEPFTLEVSGRLHEKFEVTSEMIGLRSEVDF